MHYQQSLLVAVYAAMDTNSYGSFLWLLCLLTVASSPRRLDGLGTNELEN